MSIGEKNWYRRLDPASRAAVISLFLGWMMDVYDVFIVAYLGLVIARVYLAPYLGAGAYVQAVYAAGALTATLVARAVGAMIFGPIADKRGRKGPLTVTLLGYSLFTVLTAFTVELVRPFLYGASLALGVITLFVAFRIAAGIFLGGEWTVGAPYASELLPPDIRARATAFMQMGSPAGSLLAALVPFMLTGFMGNAAFSAFGWKIAFVLGALPALLAVYVRRSLPESKVWTSAKQNKEKFKVDPKALAQTFLISAGIFTVIYATLAFYGDYVTALYGSSSLARYGSFSVSSSFLVLIFMNATALFGFLLFGHVADAAGRKKGMMAGALGLLILAPVVGPFWTSKPSLLYLIVAVSAYGIPRTGYSLARGPCCRRTSANGTPLRLEGQRAQALCTTATYSSLAGSHRWYRLWEGT
ncbi:MFS transporter [Tardisphaera miroshnichenkoae]